ncbi:hypothetical protein HC864_02065 [Candidatus Gracilibacteria bacterium]|nr:hypothetical protein [Candidatus Gracilibacteria bacterium]
MSNIEKSNNSQGEEKTQHSIFVEIFLLPWILNWGWYLILGIFILIYQSRENKFSIDLDYLVYQSAPEAIQEIFFFNLGFSFLTFIVAHLLSNKYDKINFLFFLINIFLLAFMTFLISPMILSLIF